MTNSKTVAIIGAGHNGLVAACYLARVGFGVSVFEKNSRIGGLCINEELFPEYTVSSIASFYGMLRKQIIQDLDLVSYGLETYITDPIELILLSGQHYILNTRNSRDPKRNIGEVSQQDLKNWEKLWDDLATASRVIKPLLFQAPVTKEEVKQLLKDAHLPELAKAVFEESLLSYLKRHLQNKHLIASAATTTYGLPFDRGSLFGCMYYGTAETNDIEGAWGFVKGGMGKITEALARAAKQSGVSIVTKNEIVSIQTNNSQVEGIKLQNGEIQKFDIVISNADPITTFDTLLDKKQSIKHIRKKVQLLKESLSAAKVHIALNKLPNFIVSSKFSYSYEGAIVIAPSVEELSSIKRDLSKGKFPKKLTLSMVIPSVSDKTIAPPGKHLLTIDLHYCPVLFNGQPWNSTGKQVLYETVLNCIQEYAPNIRECIDDWVVITPKDLEEDYSIRTQSCWHVIMKPERLFEDRPIAELANYETPIKNLYLCGAGMHPGGTVTGAPGYNCAQTILQKVINQ